MDSSIKQGDDHCSSSLSSQFPSPSPRWMDLSERLQERSFQGVFVSKVNRSSNARDHPDVANLHNWWWQSGHQYPLLLGSMYIWTLLNQLNRSFNYDGENSSHRNFNFQTKKDIGYPLVPNFFVVSRAFIHSFMKVSSHHSFTLFRALSVGKVTKKVFQVGSVAQNMPLGPLYTEKKENLLAHNF